MKELSPFEISMSGLDLKDWLYRNTDRHKMSKFFNLDDNKFYMLKMCDGAPVAFEVDKRGVEYEIPCDH